MTLTWKEALVLVWENLVGIRGGRAARVWRPLVFALLFLGSVWAAYGCVQIRAPRHDVSLASSGAKLLEAEDQRLRQLLERTRANAVYRAGGLVLAQSMRDTGKYAFAVPSPPPADGTTAAEGPALSLPLPEPGAPLPPVVVRAVMIAGGERAAVVDIPGEGLGKILHPGDSFLGRRARVVRITEGGLVVRWNGRDWDVALGL